LGLSPLPRQLLVADGTLTVNSPVGGMNVNVLTLPAKVQDSFYDGLGSPIGSNFVQIGGNDFDTGFPGPVAIAYSLPSVGAGGLVTYPITAVGQTTMAASSPVVIASNQSAIPVTSTSFVPSVGTITRVAASAASVQLLALNANRRGFVMVNESTVDAYVKFGTTASTTSYTYRMTGSAGSPYTTLEIDEGYSGRIDCIWASATGNMQITELS